MTRIKVTLDSIHPDTDLSLYMFLQNYRPEVEIETYTHKEASFTCSARFLHILFFLMDEDLMHFNLTYRSQRITAD